MRSILLPYFLCLSGLAALGPCMPAHGEDVSNDDGIALSERHQYVSQSLFGMVDQIDTFFGNVRSDDQRVDGFFRVGGDVRIREGDSWSYGQRLRAGLNLPRLNQQLRVILEGDRADNDLRGQQFIDTNASSTTTSFTEPGDGTFRAALRYALLKDTPFQFDVDGGLRFSGGPNPYGRVRLSRIIPINEHWAIEPTQFLLYEIEDGLFPRSRLDLIRPLDGSTLFRSRSEAVWRVDDKDTEFFQRISLYTQLARRSYMEAYASAFAPSDGAFAVEEYQIAFRHRQSHLYPWLFLELEPALVFLDERDHKATPQFTVRVDVYFEREQQAP